MVSKKKKNQNLINRGNRSINPSVNILEYNGPVKIPRNMSQTYTTTLELVYTTVYLASTVAGGINLVFGNNPNGCIDWANVIAHFDEYRTLNIHMEYYTANQYSTATGTINKYPLAVVIDRDSSGALSSYPTPAAFGSCKFFSLEEQFIYDAKASPVDELTYINTAAPSSNYWIKLYSQNNTVSTNMGILIFRYLVQFRGQI